MSKETIETIKPIKSIDDITNILYINLEKRTDRKEHIEGQLKQLGLNVFERFNAVQIKNRRAGCTVSHIKCLEIAKARKYSHLLMCEDDTTFLNVPLFKKQLNTFLKNGHQWDVVLFAGNNIPPYERIDASCISITRCQTTTCYMVNGHYFDTLIDNMVEGLAKLMREPDNHVNYAVDKYWFSLQLRDNWFLITPLSVVQREDYSDIEERRTNYMNMMVDLDKSSFMRIERK